MGTRDNDLCVTVSVSEVCVKSVRVSVCVVCSGVIGLVFRLLSVRC